MKRKREMRTLSVGETDELAKTNGSEDCKKVVMVQTCKNVGQNEK
jgi:hypothetical protein